MTVESVVDTGSAGTAIDTTQLSLDLARPGILADMVGIGGTHQVLIQNVESVSLDGATIKDFPIEFSDFSGRFAVKGIIGRDLLKMLRAKINYSTEELHCGI